MTSYPTSLIASTMAGTVSTAGSNVTVARLVA